MTTLSGLGRQVGAKGLRVFGGLVREEWLPELTSWQNASRIYREMADDTMVAVLLDAIRTPLLAADFDVTPAGDSEGDKLAADFLWANTLGMDRQSWRAHVSDALESLQFGFTISEIVMEKRDDGRLWLRNLEPRGQETLQRWEWEDDAPVAFVQRDPSTGHMLTIPIQKTLHFVFGGRKGNPQGRPLLRSIFRPWLELKYLSNFEVIGIERDIGGMPVVDFPDPEKWGGPQATTELRELFEDAFKNLRMGENTWLLMPPGSRATSWGGGPRSYDIRVAIQAKQREILLRFFAQFLMLERAGLDASGLLKGSQDFFGLGLKSIQQQLLEVWTQQLVPLLFELNHFPGMTGLPAMTWNDPGTVDVAGLVGAYLSGTQANLITPLRQDEEHFRALLDLPDLPEGEGEGPRGESVSPGPFSPFVSTPPWSLQLFQGAPGPPPRPGLVWNPGTHRWVKPDGDTGQAEALSIPKPISREQAMNSDQGGIDGVGDTEFEAVQNYADEGFREVNNSLRGGDINDDFIAGQVAALDTAIAKHGDVNVGETETWRAIHTPEAVFGTSDFESLKGGAFEDNGFVSMTSDSDIALGFVTNSALPTVLVRTLPSQTPVYGLAVGDAARFPEAEVLLPRGLRFQIQDVRKEDEFIVFDVEVSYAAAA